ncbi:pentatricopeptide repeat-containing protein At1g80150, mitochondrial-like [Vicia villosa]|uniref:pentatricopeptide repeat-containing protein At1g80150, mitochondrial-like n=1 Tax=Vicia villosa TaxID=3911 RepID=UPI00273B6F6A|nr:pentatricopeptide repeat-containing protein At1g80150, mitochondrial-like [Vicia villosa]XP_058780484.1 pentatricopeptide repeat-containing protein At1g80150, mitochondrial-like [Vicia villosa]
MLTPSLRSTRRFCHNLSSSSPLTFKTLKPLQPPVLQSLKSEWDPHNLFHLFKANATNRLLVENRFAFYDTVSRLAGAKRFDYIENLLEQQKTLPQSRREGFVVRIITLYGKAGMVQHALDTFYQMHSFKCRRTVKSFNAALNVLASSRKFDEVVRFLEEVPSRFNIKLDVYSVNIAVKAFCEDEKLQEAYLFMVDCENNKGVKPDVVTYTTLISAFYEVKRWEIGNGLWNRMVLKGCMPNLHTFNVRIQFLVTVRRAWDANALMGLMRRVGVMPDEVTLVLVIKGFFLAGYPEMAMRVFSKLHRKGYKSSANIYQTVIHYLCKREDFNQAYTMCEDSMRKNWFPNVDTIFMLLEGLKRFGEIDKVKEIVALVESRKPPFYSSYLASMQSLLSGQ